MVAILLLHDFCRLCLAVLHGTPAATPYALYLEAYQRILKVWLEPADTPPDVDHYEVC